MWTPTYDRGGLGGFDEGQGAVIGLLGNVDRAISEFVFLQDLVQLAQHPHPLALLVLAVRQHQDRTLVIRRGELGSGDLENVNQTHIREQTPF